MHLELLSSLLDYFTQYFEFIVDFFVSLLRHLTRPFYARDYYGNITLRCIVIQIMQHLNQCVKRQFSINKYILYLFNPKMQLNNNCIHDDVSTYLLKLTEYYYFGMLLELWIDPTISCNKYNDIKSVTCININGIAHTDLYHCIQTWLSRHID